MLLSLIPNLTVIAYSPPGCIFDYDLAVRSERWINSIFLGSDMIPHANWRSLLKLRGQILDCLRRSKTSKTKVMKSAFKGNVGYDGLLYTEDEIPATFARRELALKINALWEQSKASSSLLHRVNMHCPGRIVHLVRSEIEKKNTDQNKDEEVFIPYLIEDRRTLNDFIMSRRMIFDHFPDIIASALCSVVCGDVDRSEIDSYILQTI